MPDDDKRDARPDLELEIGVGMAEVEFRHLVSVSSTFAQLVNEVAQSYGGDAKGVKWIVGEVKEGSVRLPLRAKPADDAVAVDRELPSVITQGIAQLEREATRPEHFSDKALEQVKALANAGLPVRVSNGAGRLSISKEIGRHAEQALAKTHAHFGTLEGRLEELHLHQAKEFSIWEPDGTKVRCFFSKHLTLDDILEGVDKRVAVRGTIRSRSDGQAISINVETLTVLGLEAVPADEVRGIFKDHEVADW